MGATRFVFVFVLLALCLEYIVAAPKPSPSALAEQQDLAQRFVEFLHEDKELAGALEKVDWDEDHLVRNRRQATSSTQGLDSEEYDPPQEKPGFFDRAAKFVTELLQRFLKWVNSSENH